jgi:hypothetical protein
MRRVNRMDLAEATVVMAWVEYSAACGGKEA